MKLRSVFLALTALLITASCARVYTSTDVESRTRKHQVIAILPPTVSIAAMRKVDAEALREQQWTESKNFQNEMYSWLLRRKSRNKLDIEVQDVATTNALLEKAGYTIYNQQGMTPAELSKTLGVDAVILSNYALSKPMSEGAAIALGFFTGLWGPTQEAAVNLELHDAQAEKLLWNYNRTVSGGIGTSHATLVDHVMRHASRKLPYAK